MLVRVIITSRGLSLPDSPAGVRSPADSHHTSNAASTAPAQKKRIFDLFIIFPLYRVPTNIKEKSQKAPHAGETTVSAGKLIARAFAGVYFYRYLCPVSTLSRPFSTASPTGETRLRDAGYDSGNGGRRRKGKM